jgi:hypothetical protein
MLRLSLTITTEDQARAAIAQVTDALSKSDISEGARGLIANSLGPTLELWAQQLGNPQVSTFKADRVFDGDGYHIVIRGRRASSGLGGFVNRLLGRG